MSGASGALGLALAALGSGGTGGLTLSGRGTDYAFGLGLPLLVGAGLAATTAVRSADEVAGKTLDVGVALARSAVPFALVLLSQFALVGPDREDALITSTLFAFGMAAGLMPFLAYALWLLRRGSAE